MPTPWQNVYGVVWGVLILRVVERLALVHRKPLSNTPGIATVEEKRKKELLRPGDGANWHRMYHTKAYARPSQRVAENIYMYLH